MARPILCGVYSITHTATQRRYIGSSISIYSRWEFHRGTLRRGVHVNEYLQEAWNTDGPSAFTWDIVELVPDAAQLHATEQKWLDHYQSADRAHGFNIDPHAASAIGRKLSPGTRAGLRGRKSTPRTEEWKRAASERMRGNKHGAGSHYHGKLTDADVYQILTRRIAGETTRALAAEFRVAGATITRITRRAIWTNVALTPDQEAALQQVRAGFVYEKDRSHARFRLTASDIPSIRARLAAGELPAAIAASYGVSTALIQAIRHGRVWTHINDKE